MLEACLTLSARHHGSTTDELMVEIAFHIRSQIGQQNVQEYVEV